MTTLNSTYRVSMEDGSTFEVSTDQRDVAAWEIQPFGCSVAESFTRIFTYSRFVAWHAGKRTKQHKLTWDQFSERCVSVDSVDKEETEAADPGQSAASAESSSS